MANKRFWGRFKISGKWSTLWHIIPGAGNRDEAFRKFISNTRFRANEVQITDREPKKWAGRK